MLLTNPKEPAMNTAAARTLVLACAVFAAEKRNERIDLARIDASWTAPVVAVTKNPVAKRFPSVQPTSLFASLVSPIAAHRHLGGLAMRRSHTARGEVVIVACSAKGGNTADQHRAVAARLTMALCNDGWCARQDGYEVRIERI